MNLSKLIAITLPAFISACSYLGPSDPLTHHGRGEFNKPSVQSAPLNFETLRTQVLQPKCLKCHGKLGVEENFKNRAAQIEDSVFNRKSMPKAPVSPLSDCQLELLSEYLEHGEQLSMTVADLDSCNGVEADPTPTPEPTSTPEPTPNP